MRTLKDFFFLLALSLAAIVGLVKVSLAGSQATYQTNSGSSTVYALFVSSNAPFQLDSGVIKMNAPGARRSSFELWNDDALATVWCGFSNTISSNTPSFTGSGTTISNYTRSIPPGKNSLNPWVVYNSWNIPVYCVSNSSATVVLTQHGAWGQ